MYCRSFEYINYYCKQNINIRVPYITVVVILNDHTYFKDVRSKIRCNFSFDIVR